MTAHRQLLQPAQPSSRRPGNNCRAPAHCNLATLQLVNSSCSIVFGGVILLVNNAVIDESRYIAAAHVCMILVLCVVRHVFHWSGTVCKMSHLQIASIAGQSELPQLCL